MQRVKTVLLILFFTAVYQAGAGNLGTGIIEAAADLVGTPYRYQGTGSYGFDCSGLVYHLYQSHVPGIPRSSSSMYRFAAPVELEDAVPGDLVFFNTMGPSSGVTHVAIYAGGYRVIHSVSNGPQTGVIVSKIDTGYWRRTFYSIGRVLPIEAAAAVVVTAVVDVEPVSVAENIVPETEPEAEAWGEYDGPVYGDYDSWRKKDEEDFEKHKQQDRKGSR